MRITEFKQGDIVQSKDGYLIEIDYTNFDENYDFVFNKYVGYDTPPKVSLSYDKWELADEGNLARFYAKYQKESNSWRRKLL